MLKKMNVIAAVALMAALPFLAGCFTKDGMNPLASNSFSSNTGNQITAVPATDANAQVLAAKFITKSNKKYTFAEPSHEVSHRMREGLSKAAGFLRFGVKADSKTDHIFITLGEMKVKRGDVENKSRHDERERHHKDNGKWLSVNIPTREIDLFAAADLTQLVSDANLSSGVYTGMSFEISSARAIINGKSYTLFIPSNRVRFSGKFEIREGFRTELSIRILHKILKVWTPSRGQSYMFVPVIKISSKLVEVIAPPPQVTDGDVSGTILDFVKKTPIAGVNATLEGTSFAATTDANGAFTFAKVPQGTYNLKLTQADYIDKAFPVAVTAAQVASVSSEMNPAVIKSTLGSTGWFSLEYPLADARGKYGEVSMETPVVIDFASLSFLKVEVAYDGEYSKLGGGNFDSYLSASQQVQTITNMGTWWVGNSATYGLTLGNFVSNTPAVHYVVDVTTYVRNNPNALYYLAARNNSPANMKLNNIQMTIYYR